MRTPHPTCMWSFRTNWIKTGGVCRARSGDGLKSDYKSGCHIASAYHTMVLEHNTCSCTWHRNLVDIKRARTRHVYVACTQIVHCVGLQLRIHTNSLHVLESYAGAAKLFIHININIKVIRFNMLWASSRTLREVTKSRQVVSRVTPI